MENPKVKFLEESLHLNHNLRTALDYKANFLLATSGVILALSVPSYNLILIIFSSLSAIFCILAIDSPFRKVKDNSHLCWWGIKNKNFVEYKKICDQINSEDDLIKEYQIEIYNLFQNSIKNKLIFIRLSAIFLLIAFLLSLIKLL